MKVTQAGFISIVAFVKFLPSAFRPSLPHMSQSHGIPHNVRASCQMLSKHSSFSHIDIVHNLNDCSSVNLLSSGAGTAFRELEINNNFLHH